MAANVSSRISDLLALEASIDNDYLHSTNQSHSTAQQQQSSAHRSAFDLIDTDGNGVIDRVEWNAAVQLPAYTGMPSWSSPNPQVQPSEPV